MVWKEERGEERRRGQDIEGDICADGKGVFSFSADHVKFCGNFS